MKKILVIFVMAFSLLGGTFSSAFAQETPAFGRTKEYMRNYIESAMLWNDMRDYCDIMKDFSRSEYNYINACIASDNADAGAEGISADLKVIENMEEAIAIYRQNADDMKNSGLMSADEYAAAISVLNNMETAKNKIRESMETYIAGIRAKDSSVCLQAGTYFTAADNMLENLQETCGKILESYLAMISAILYTELGI